MLFYLHFFLILRVRSNSTEFKSAHNEGLSNPKWAGIPTGPNDLGKISHLHFSHFTDIVTEISFVIFIKSQASFQYSVSNRFKTYDVDDRRYHDMR